MMPFNSESFDLEWKNRLVMIPAIRPTSRNNAVIAIVFVGKIPYSKRCSYMRRTAAAFGVIASVFCLWTNASRHVRNPYRRKATSGAKEQEKQATVENCHKEVKFAIDKSEKEAI